VERAFSWVFLPSWSCSLRLKERSRTIYFVVSRSFTDEGLLSRENCFGVQIGSNCTALCVREVFFPRPLGSLVDQVSSLGGRGEVAGTDIFEEEGRVCLAIIKVF